MTASAFPRSLVLAVFVSTAVPGAAAGADGPTVAAEYEKGQELLSQEQYELAIIAFSTVIAADPRAPSGYLSRGWTRLKAGDLKQAEADLVKAVELSSPARRPVALSLRGAVRFERGNEEAALRDLNEAVSAAPNDAMVLLQRSALLTYSGRLHEASADAELAAKLDPRNPFAVGALGFVLSFGTRREEAVSALRRALALSTTECGHPAAWLFALTGESDASDSCAPKKPWQQSLLEFVRGAIGEAEFLRRAHAARHEFDRATRVAEAQIVLGVVVSRKVCSS
jgi:tetratricopeptide (TPR) repeat protein